MRKDKGSRERIYLDDPLPSVLTYSGLLWRLLSEVSFSCPRTAVAQLQTNGEKDVHAPLHRYSVTHSNLSDELFSPKNGTEKACNLYLSELGKSVDCCPGSSHSFWCINVVQLAETRLYGLKSFTLTSHLASKSELVVSESTSND